MEVDPCVLHEASELGIKYVAAMMLAGEYAYAGREWVVEKVRSIVGRGNVTESVHNHHNYAWVEQHHGRALGRAQGATPAFPGQRGFVGGSLGDNAVVLSGVESELSEASLNSTVHGAGRVMSRTEARGKWRKGVQRTESRIRHDDWPSVAAGEGVTVLGGDVDEAPRCTEGSLTCSRPMRAPFKSSTPFDHLGSLWRAL
jgi:tRNA-splicing ligase RtcB